MMQPGSFRKIKRYLISTISIAALFALYLLYEASHCDVVEQGKLVTTPEGKQMPLYSELKHAKSFGELSTKCEYDGDIIDCPDVRHLGISMNHQSQLVVGRMLAILNLICRRYNIKYFIAFSTLLGAKRSGRMLTWDYDGDVGMMIDDYRQLLKYIRKDLPDDLLFQDGSDNPWYKRAPDSKLRDRNSCYTTCLRYGCKWEDGLQLDIFVYRRKDEVSDILFNYFHPAIYNINDVLPTKSIKLEGLTVQGPNNVEAVLTSIYGPDFIKPPAKARGQCSLFGYLSVPWYSCDYIKNLPKDKKDSVLRMSEDRRRHWFSYLF